AVRVGSCGGLQPGLAPRDGFPATGACTGSGGTRVRYGGYAFAASADVELLAAAHRAARDAGVPVRVGNVHSADLFYNPEEGVFERMRDMGVLAVEMEAAGLYGVAAERGARALTIVTVSDHILRGEETTSDERETTFDDMVKVALEAVVIDVG